MKINFTDEELGFLYSLTYRASFPPRPYRRRRARMSAGERAAHSIAVTVKNKIRSALPRGAARAIDILQETVF